MQREPHKREHMLGHMLGHMQQEPHMQEHKLGHMQQEPHKREHMLGHMQREPHKRDQQEHSLGPQNSWPLERHSLEHIHCQHHKQPELHTLEHIQLHQRCRKHHRRCYSRSMDSIHLCGSRNRSMVA
jgi:hypothetical protein